MPWTRRITTTSSRRDGMAALDVPDHHHQHPHAAMEAAALDVPDHTFTSARLRGGRDAMDAHGFPSAVRAPL